MHISAYGFLAGISILLIADAPVDLPDAITPQMLQGSALMILGGTVFYLLTRTFPAFLAALKDQRDAFLAHLQKRDERQE